MLTSVLTAAFIASSSFILSSAQISGSSQECATAYNSLFTNTSESAEACVNAYNAYVERGNATDQQKMLVCDDDQPCNDMIENVIDACGDTIISPTKLSHALSCATDANGTTCISTYFDYIYGSVTNIIEEVLTNCLYCNQACEEYLTRLNNTWGCCTAEIFEVFSEQDDGTLASFLTYATTCARSLGSFTLCNGDALSPTPCSVATADLHGSNDECGRAVESLLFGGGAITNLFIGNCPILFLNYTTACPHLYGDELVQFANTVYVTSQARTHDGRYCSESFQMIPDAEADEVDSCNEDFFVRKCSSRCKQALMEINSHYGCCYNTFLAELFNIGNIVENQITYATVTRDIYELCDVESNGFCTGTIPPPYSEAAERCSSVANSFSPNDNCLSHYYALGLRSSAYTVNSAAAAICTNDFCTRHMSRYINYLLTCQVVSLDDDDDDDDDYDYDYYDNIDDMEEADRILANVIGNTTCRVDSNKSSCYFVITSSPVYTKFLEAFDLKRPYPLCGSVFNESTCWPGCAEFLREAEQSLGCCLVEYGLVVLGNDGIQKVSTVCDIPLDTRCPELEGVYGSASSQKGTRILIALLLGMINLFAY